LRALQQYFRGPNEDEFRIIVDLIGLCSWVDMVSAQRIRDCAERDETKRTPVLGLNADEARTANCYVLTASELGPRDNWRIGIPHGVFNSYEDLDRQVQSALFEALMREGEVDCTKLKRQLDALQHDKEPVFVVLRSEGLKAGWLEKLRQTELFEWVNFLVLTGAAGGACGLLPEDAMLRPVLSAGSEAEVWKTYETTKAILRLA
jgi:hypothetical protein